MSPEGSIHVEQLWKRFRADRSRRVLRDYVQAFRHLDLRIRRRGWRWALNDISFDVRPGEAVGLVGLNGSGKSTLLKLLSGVMYPYAGRADAVGRIGALIEVRSGIHPELTGIENIFFYGSMLGLRRREVARRLDEIVAFAELHDAVDRQVKFYSTGMQMRLGFAVAAFLEPDVLLVDEVLAVGDAGFQHKCLDRMREVLAQGTTLFYVSHDLPTVEATCERGMWLRDGVMAADGSLPDVLASYRAFIEETAELYETHYREVSVSEAAVVGSSGNGARTNDRLTIRLVLESRAARPANIFLGVTEGTASPIFTLRRETYLREGRTIVTCEVHRLPLSGGQYFLWGGVIDKETSLLGWHPLTRFHVSGPPTDKAPPGVVRAAPLHVSADWDVERKP
jgi:ABC-type polysaccharide/polyol phosphate transport system ATPase subunit